MAGQTVCHVLARISQQSGLAAHVAAKPPCNFWLSAALTTAEIAAAAANAADAAAAKTRAPAAAATECGVVQGDASPRTSASHALRLSLTSKAPSGGPLRVYVQWRLA